MLCLKFLLLFFTLNAPRGTSNMLEQISDSAVQYETSLHYYCIVHHIGSLKQLSSILILTMAHVTTCMWNVLCSSLHLCRSVFLFFFSSFFLFGCLFGFCLFGLFHSHQHLFSSGSKRLFSGGKKALNATSPARTERKLVTCWWTQLKSPIFFSGVIGERTSA